MKVYNGIRELIGSSPPIDPGRTPAEDRAGVALPGDPVEGFDNPFLGRNPQAVLRLLRSGSLSPDQEALARDALAVFEGVSGENLTGGIERAMPIPKLGVGAGERAEIEGARREIDQDVLDNPNFDPELADLFR